ncbi:HNH endonuclease [Citrobacter braakii]|nr:HNH endonuclease [Citrobacter braakii]
MKVCAKCCEEKPYTEFHSSKNRIDGKHPYCKTCDASKRRKPEGELVNGRREMPDAEWLKETICYRDGVLSFRKSRGGILAGSPLGYESPNGYLHVRLQGILYPVHRIVWKLHQGTDPEFIDHVDGDKKNNNIHNLREVTRTQNNRNASLSKANTTGFTGVTFAKREGMYRAEIYAEGKRKSLGYYSKIKDAVLAYNSACDELHGEYGKRKIEHNLSKLREMGLM